MAVANSRFCFRNIYGSDLIHFFALANMRDFKLFISGSLQATTVETITAQSGLRVEGLGCWVEAA